jgi:hypothetical protein
MRKRDCTALLIAALVLLSSSPILACSCDTTPQDQAFHLADVVFHGRVDQIRNIGRGLWDAELQLVTMRVIASWKGLPGKTVTVFSLARPKMCDGYSFTKSTEYIVYASTKGTWRDSYGSFSKDPVLEVGELCPLRIRIDVANEARLLRMSAGVGHRK